MANYVRVLISQLKEVRGATFCHWVGMSGMYKLSSDAFSSQHNLKYWLSVALGAIHIWRPQNFGIFRPPPPLVCIWDWSTVLNSRNLPYYIFFWANPPPPSVRTSYMDAPKRQHGRGRQSKFGGVMWRKCQLQSTTCGLSSFLRFPWKKWRTFH